MIYDKAPSSALRARAREMGMRTLREDGIRKVLAGLTTPEEVIRATIGDEALSNPPNDESRVPNSTSFFANGRFDIRHWQFII